MKCFVHVMMNSSFASSNGVDRIKLIIHARASSAMFPVASSLCNDTSPRPVSLYATPPTPKLSPPASLPTGGGGNIAKSSPNSGFCHSLQIATRTA